MLQDFLSCLFLFAHNTLFIVAQLLIFISVPCCQFFFFHCPLIRYNLWLFKIAVLSKIAGNCYVLSFNWNVRFDFASQTYLLAVLDHDLCKDFNHWVICIFILDSTVCIVRKYLYCIANYKISFFNLELCQRHPFV